MQIKRNKLELMLYSVFGIVLFLSLYLYGTWRKGRINSDSVFAIGKVTVIENNADGINFCYKYYYKGIEYKQCLTTWQIDHQDSLIVVKFSSSNPELSERTDFTLPFNLVTRPIFDSCWASP
jgi:hypothetical protein